MPTSSYRINLNVMDVEICAREGGEVSLPIGQIKEVRRLTMEYLYHQIRRNGVSGVLAVLDAIERAGHGEDEVAIKDYRPKGFD